MSYTHLMSWARTVVKLTPRDKDRKSIFSWYKGKTAKTIYGTDEARHYRQALRKAIEEDKISYY